MASVKIIVCWSCKQEVEVSDKVIRTDICTKCELPLKCCYNCHFYDRSAYHQCNEPQAEWVRYKEKANFCEYFTVRRPVVPQPATRQSATDPPPKRDKTKSAWDSLFKE
jgi:hypothetical protein